ncbi:MFS transporter [Gracilibacillus sp. S3-1-1]|uniref:MFS transporter n=1 Tax=Gracilibacillus pellucidus TaxID=3095368 RepID=A0ACC6M0C7_9BACI|nr:MFS transporter [Gracilibacillus sp. S3-1-1]MDX8044384.1 MFS transporter [Gracilibacillus sp. S3-1-1]
MNTSKRSLAITFFMISTFAIGMTEYVVTGLLTQFARDLDVAVSTTGLLLSVYAISVAVFGPLLRIITIKIAPKPLLLALMALFIISNMMAALAPNFEVLLLSRLFSAAMHAPFFGIAMTVAISISEKSKGTKAIALVQGGLTIAVMLGVPFGSFIGGMFHWRYVFWFIVLSGIIAFIGMFFTTPNIKPDVPPVLKEELKMVKNKSVMLVMAIIVFGFSGVFTAYTFQEPMLRDITGFGLTGITVAMLCFGIGAVLGNFLSGSVAPEQLTKRLMQSLGLLAVVLAAFTFLIPVKSLALVMAFLFGIGTFGTTPLLNAKIILGAKEAPALSGTIAGAVFNLANSLGAMLGTLLLSNGISYRGITFTAAGIILFGLLLAVITNRVEDKSLYYSSERS